MPTQQIVLALLSCLGLLQAGQAAVAQPTVTTLPATGVPVTNAILNGTINPNGAATTAYFQYGLTTSYGNIGTATVLPAANVTSNVPGLLVSSLNDAAGPNVEVTGAPFTFWGAVAASVDGLKLVAAANNPGGIFTSTNGGESWAVSGAVTNYWQSIASSADGVRLAAVPRTFGGIYISTNSGLSWTNAFPTNQSWNSIASSYDGLRLAAAGSIGIHTSTDGGLTWAESSGPAAWQSIASSANGERLAAVMYNGGVWTSTNGGSSWAQSGAPTRQWQCVASSADGIRLSAGAHTGGGVYTSTNSGLTWQQTGLTTADSWTALASSADGARLAAVASFVYTSVNGGATWTPGSLATTWQTVALSADGTRLVTAQRNANVWTSAGAMHSLLPGTAYHYRLVGINSAGKTLGNDMTFTTSAGAPTVTTEPAGDVKDTNATVNGTVNTGGTSTSSYFQYGLTTNYGSFSATNTFPGTNTTQFISNLITDLAPVTTYHFRLIGSNSFGISVGGDQLLTTTPPPPAVTTLPATGVTTSNAMLSGTVNPNGRVATAYFQYGLTTNYGSFSGTNSLAATNVVLSVSNLVSGLLAGATYHFRLVASGVGGTAVGGSQSFSLGPLAPTVVTMAASAATGTNATLNGMANPNGGATTAYFQYGLTTNYGSFSPTNGLPATNSMLSVSKPISGLLPGETYHFRLVASNSAGVTAGQDQSIGISPHSFTGAEPGQGLDLQGAFLYAVNLGSNGAPGLIGDANFTADNVPGVTVTTPGNTLNTINDWANPNFGTSAGALRLAQAMSSIRWTGAPGTFMLNLDGLQVGGRYQLQLLFIEGNSVTDRAFTVSVNGMSVVPNFRLLNYGPAGTPIVIPYLFTAASTSALIQLGGGDVGTDHNPIMSAFTLEALSRPALSRVTRSGTNLILTITNGVPSGGWTLLSTTNLTPPLKWSTNRSGTFDGLGNFAVTNGITATEPRRFFNIRSP